MSRAWIQTYTGLRFDLLRPRPDQIAMEDIAHALAALPRFTGHTTMPYSVAQHSVLVARECVDDVGAAWGLLHDAAEAYTGDVNTPLKDELPRLRKIERGILRAIARRFGLPWPVPEIIKMIDRRLLATERRDLMQPTGLKWGSLPEPYPWPIICWSFVQAKRMFFLYAENLLGEHPPRVRDQRSEVRGQRSEIRSSDF